MPLSTDSAIYYNFGIGPVPFFCFGTLTMTEAELAFKPDGLPWTPGWGRASMTRIVKAEGKPPGHAVRRRLVWIVGALLFLIPGILGLPWLLAFWRRAGSATLEVSVKRDPLRRSRVYMVENPEEWADAINRLVGHL